eukprot:6085408-Amphidinium_carterae.1
MSNVSGKAGSWVAFSTTEARSEDYQSFVMGSKQHNALPWKATGVGHYIRNEPQRIALWKET